jgi:hypothetical protein
LTDTNLVFDTGANTGPGTAALLSRGLRVVAIEANLKLCADLRARLLAESLGSLAAGASPSSRRNSKHPVGGNDLTLEFDALGAVIRHLSAESATVIRAR